MLVLRQFVPGDSFETSMVGKPLRKLRSAGQVHATLYYGPQEAEAKAQAVPATMNDVPALIFHGAQRVASLTPAEEAAVEEAAKRGLPFELAPVSPARERAATWLKLGKALPFDLVLDTGPMDKPLAALRTCSWDTIRSWGLDVEVQKRLARKAQPTRQPFSWFSADDYPDEMVRQGRQAIVHFRVIVDEAGKPASCHVQVSTRPEAFDDVVCGKIMRNARFHPALNAQAEPVRSYWRQTVVFRIEQ
jgi:TonB family protein